MQFTPPHSPPPPASGDTAMFAKRPISPPLSSTSASVSGETSAAEDSSHHLHHKTAAPVSLLSALLHSPDHSHAQQAMSSASGAYLSPHSSVPSTAVSSPHLHPSSQGGQQVPAISILRRDSFSSDAETSAGGGCGDALSMQPIDTRTDLPKRACSLKFAVAPPSSKRRQAESGAQSDHQQQETDVPALPKIKADVPQPHRTASEEDTPIAVDRDDEEEDEDDDENEDTKGDGSEDSDLGYQEDSEQSSDDEDRIRSAPKYPFARSTNYRRRRQRQEEARSPSPPPAPSVLPPPTRRGRGHIRVDESCISGKETEGGCSRHRSPPPAKSRSTSGDRERMGRLSDAGPRRNRAGSPMPTRIHSDEDDEDDEDQQQLELEPDSPTAGQRRVASQPGWRSDDAAFREPVKTARAVSAPSAVISDEEGLGLGTSMDPNEISPPAGGVRSFFRRASEHLPLPAFRRPSKQLMEPPLLSSDYSMQPQAQQAPHRPAMPINHACPPALDDTPALANSIARVETNYSGGLAHRLEKQLSTRSSPASASHPAAAALQVHAHA